MNWIEPKLASILGDTGKSITQEKQKYLYGYEWLIFLEYGEDGIFPPVYILEK